MPRLVCWATSGAGRSDAGSPVRRRPPYHTTSVQPDPSSVSILPGEVGSAGLPLVNVGVDALVGGIPVLGDVADTLFKAHVRNQRIIDDYMASEQYAV
jgi:hypothetical protein